MSHLKVIVETVQIHISLKLSWTRIISINGRSTWLPNDGEDNFRKASSLKWT